MEYINPPAETSENILHRTFYSTIYGRELGYCIYLPDGYETDRKRYPVHYHLHGWTDHESSHIKTMEPIYRGRDVITVFPNNSPVIEDREELPVEEMVIRELIPLIDENFRTVPTREGRTLSGFSMGGGMAFCWAVKYPELFSAVTAYAGTYHHYFHKDYPTVGVPAEKAPEIYRAMTEDAKPFDKSVLHLVKENVGQICGRLVIELHVGTEDVLYCDNEILRLHLESLQIPHCYKTFPGVSHRLSDIL